MFKLLKYAFYIIVLLVLYMLNPSLEQHGKAIQEQTAKENVLSSLFGAGWVKSKLVSYKDFYVCSYTTYKDTFVSFGAANHVWVINFDASKIKEIKEKMSE